MKLSARHSRRGGGETLSYALSMQQNTLEIQRRRLVLSHPSNLSDPQRCQENWKKNSAIQMEKYSIECSFPCFAPRFQAAALCPRETLLNQTVPSNARSPPHSSCCVFLRRPSSRISVGRINTLCGLFWLASVGRGPCREGPSYLPHMQRPDVSLELRHPNLQPESLACTPRNYEALSVFLLLSGSLSPACVNMY